ncbi:uncharacterized protein N7511_007690 [Penicillium nucicola]|uniref:uncharacterized protein n=1 Tax=Penicillium nucicola TaxID=1850975 RepID=UPI0025456252|nr:uncharacterized protein N7511_007690 [Penicillium nucicola]KAJ5753537.1 hypothetical protein N7511_007690 [Penicillium nucicola]
MPAVNFHHNTITVSGDCDVKLTLDDQNNPDEPLSLLCPGETKKDFTGKLVCVEPYGTYSTRSWRLSQGMDAAENEDVTVTDQSKQNMKSE